MCKINKTIGLGLFISLLLAGCFNGQNTHVRLGDVSLGQQLIDLKRALDEEAMTETEYLAAKEQLLALDALCANTEGEEF